LAHGALAEAPARRHCHGDGESSSQGRRPRDGSSARDGTGKQKEQERHAMFKRIDHIELVTTNADRAVQFYTGVLGFTVRERVRVPSTPMGPLDLVYLDLGGTTVELMSYPEARIDAQPAGERLGYRMMAIEVDDMDEALAYLRSKAIEASWGPVKRPSYARAEIRDPDGNGIELRQWLP
jgi:glyoxylase I family protein